MEKLQPIPEGYEESIDRILVAFEDLNQPKFKGYLKISARPAGSNMSVSEDLYCYDKDSKSHQVIFDAVCSLLQKARKMFGKKDFLFEIVNKRNDTLFNIRLNVSRRVLDIINRKKTEPPAAPAAEPVQEDEKKTRPIIIEVPAEIIPANETLPVAAPQPAVEKLRETLVTPLIPPPMAAEKRSLRKKGGAPRAPEPAPFIPPMAHPPAFYLKKPRDAARVSREKPVEVPVAEVPSLVDETPTVQLKQQEAVAPVTPPEPAHASPAEDSAPNSSNGEWKYRPCPNPDAPIDYKSMLYFPTEQAPRTIRKAFDVCNIRTNGDILKRLGTVEPTRQDWEIFIREIRAEAAKGGAKFWDSCDGHLYWWLMKKMRWIHPFSAK